MFIEVLRLGPLETNCWLVSDDDSASFVVIDPADDIEAISTRLGTRPVDSVVLTHCHFDHLAAAEVLIEETGAPLLVHESDADYITTATGTGGVLFGFQAVAPPASRTLRDGDVVEGGGVQLRVLHTPGHTPGCICLYAEPQGGGAPHLFSGDTLFSGSVGRTDFPRGDAVALRRSIAEKLAGLPPETIVHPGHGPDTTIAREARVNPFWPRS